MSSNASEEVARPQVAAGAPIALVPSGLPAPGSARDDPQPHDRRIVRAAIHPAIGVARVGNSPDGYFIGPQVAEPTPAAPGFYRDAEGALKRQAAEFRIYGYDAAGEVVREITAERDAIRWSVHLANGKSAWYQWQIALDIPEAAAVSVGRRNAGIVGVAARAGLAIDGGLRSIVGSNAHGVEFDGRFGGVPVYLGELRTDAAGRLLVLPGRGVSASPGGRPVFVKSDPNPFANADGWYDDIADGPVTAVVEIDGLVIDVEPAWVLSAPPNYAPLVKGERTLYDLLYDLYVRAGWLAAPASVSFRHDVYPLLQRLTGLQWVNQGFANQFGHLGRYDFGEPGFVERLRRRPAAGTYDPNTELRRQIFNSFRPPEAADGNQLPWPWLYGDAMDVPAGSSPRQNASITDTQYGVLRHWVQGDFDDDWHTALAPPGAIDAVALPEQPAMLDRSALEFCLADGFHPGCETTWPMRHLTMYARPFRIRHRAEGVPEPDAGPALDQSLALAADGPLHEQVPGGLTRWMAVPWQADTAWCRAGYDTAYDPLAPSFWPARVPNQVLAAADYAVVVDPDEPAERRQQAFSQRTDWNQPIGDDLIGAMERMLRIFGSMGLVEVRLGVTGDPAFPPVMMVASYGPDAAVADAVSVPVLRSAAAAAHPGATQPQPPSLPRGANFSSAEAARQAPLPVRVPR